MNCDFNLPLLPLAVFLGVFGLLSNIHAAEGTSEAFNYGNYAEVLKTYVDDNGMVNYKELKANRENLDMFVTDIGALDPDTYAQWNDSEKIAFLINTYNALTLKLIIDHYPIKSSFFKSLIWPKNSIRQISGAWDKITFKVMDNDMTLDHIEHEILRKEFNEPRIHMAIVCASKGCAQLANKPYTGDELINQLDHNTNLFFKNPEKFRIDRDKNTVRLSPYFKWFGKDFIKTYGTDERFAEHSETERAALNFIGNYLTGADQEYLATTKYGIRYLHYDWSLNEQKKD